MVETKEPPQPTKPRQRNTLFPLTPDQVTRAAEKFGQKGTHQVDWDEFHRATENLPKGTRLIDALHAFIKSRSSKGK